jgi:hypothetical protein
MRVIIGPKHLLDLVEKLQGNPLAVFPIGALYLLEDSQLGCDLIDVMLVMLIDRSMIVDPAGLLILNDIILGLQLLELIGDLELQRGVRGEIIEQIVKVSQLLVLGLGFLLDLVEVVADLDI